MWPFNQFLSEFSLFAIKWYPTSQNISCELNSLMYCLIFWLNGLALLTFLWDHVPTVYLYVDLFLVRFVLQQILMSSFCD